MTTSISGPGAGAVAPPGTGPSSNWTAGRIISVVIGAILALVALGLLTGGGILLWAGQTQRTDGYLTMPSRPLAAGGYAVTSDVIALQPGAADWASTSLLGTIRVRVTPAAADRPVFVGIAPASSVQAYLAGVPYATVTGFPGSHGVSYLTQGGTVRPAAPLTRHFWTAQASGTGQQTITWAARGGDWMVVVMNASGAPGIAVSADAGATIPALTGIAAGLLIGGVVVAAGAAALLVIPIRRASRGPAAPQLYGQPPQQYGQP
jgi:hypothetical protein